MKKDVIILGAGGAGMMCAIQAGRRGRQVLIIDHSKAVGGKILISGGGRCNFTNIGASPAQYVSKNPHFMKSALSRYQPADFIKEVESYQIPYHEKKLGQLFCDQSARDIVRMLKSECDSAGAEFNLGTRIMSVEKMPENSECRFKVQTSAGDFFSNSLVIATGGLSIPKLGATGIGYEIAKQFGLKVVPTEPALDGFVFNESESNDFTALSGVSSDVLIQAGGKVFRENILFTHAGLSGPASLQASLHWRNAEPVVINFSPDKNIFEFLLSEKKKGNRSQLKTVLSLLISSRLSEVLCRRYLPTELPLPQIPEKELRSFSEKLHVWSFVPKSTVGYSKAEVTRGGVDTDELSSKTMETRKIPGLYFIGEVVDVTGWLGGYNFQWAWASGWAAGQAV